MLLMVSGIFSHPKMKADPIYLASIDDTFGTLQIPWASEDASGIIKFLRHR